MEKNEKGEKIILTECEEVELHLLQRNKKHLRQASDTPIADGALGEMIDWDGTRELPDRLLKGEPTPDLAHLDSTIKAYMEVMAANKLDTIDSIKTKLSIEQYRNFWNKKKENTATSPFELHIGHFKSVTGKGQEEILDMNRHMLLLPIKFGFVPKRWAQTVQIMFEKDKGSPWTHRLRIIELFDSQLNAGMQFFLASAWSQKHYN